MRWSGVGPEDEGSTFVVEDSSDTLSIGSDALGGA